MRYSLLVISQEATEAEIGEEVRDGAIRVQDGPFADTKEKLNGTFVIEVDDLDAAIAWAEKCPGAQYGAVEIRPSGVVFTDGSWHAAG